MNPKVSQAAVECGICVSQGGQAQRVILALALALQPEVLLLDEVTSALDHEAVLKVEKVLKACGAALIWVTHNDDQPARYAPRGISINQFHSNS